MLAEETAMDAGDLNTHRESRSRKSLGANRKLPLLAADQLSSLTHHARRMQLARRQSRRVCCLARVGALPLILRIT